MFCFMQFPVPARHYRPTRRAPTLPNRVWVQYETKINKKNNIIENLTTFVAANARLLPQAVECTLFFITSQQKLHPSVTA